MITVRTQLSPQTIIRLMASIFILLFLLDVNYISGDSVLQTKYEVLAAGSPSDLEDALSRFASSNSLVPLVKETIKHLGIFSNRSLVFAKPVDAFLWGSDYVIFVDVKYLPEGRYIVPNADLVYGWIAYRTSQGSAAPRYEYVGAFDLHGHPSLPVDNGWNKVIAVCDGAEIGSVNGARAIVREHKSTTRMRSQTSTCKECRPPGSGNCSWCNGSGKITWYKQKNGWMYYHREGGLHVYQQKNDAGRIETLGTSEAGPTDLDRRWEVAFKKDCQRCIGTGKCSNCSGVGRTK